MWGARDEYPSSHVRQIPIRDSVRDNRRGAKVCGHLSGTKPKSCPERLWALTPGGPKPVRGRVLLKG